MSLGCGSGHNVMGWKGRRGWPALPGRPEPCWSWALMGRAGAHGRVGLWPGLAHLLSPACGPGGLLPAGRPRPPGRHRNHGNRAELVGGKGQPCPCSPPRRGPPPGVYIVCLGVHSAWSSLPRGQAVFMAGRGGQWAGPVSPVSAWHQALSLPTGFLTFSSLRNPI